MKVDGDIPLVDPIWSYVAARQSPVIVPSVSRVGDIVIWTVIDPQGTPREWTSGLERQGTG